MNDNHKEETEAQGKKPIQIIITLEANGQVKVQAPFDNGILCYGLLELAKEVVFEMRHRKQVIEPQKHGIMDFIRKK